MIHISHLSPGKINLPEGEKKCSSALVHQQPLQLHGTNKKNTSGSLCNCLKHPLGAETGLRLVTTWTAIQYLVNREESSHLPVNHELYCDGLRPLLDRLGIKN